ncbi:MAG: RNA ligase (ATP) [Candidatus Buchananbacteria bacterium]
MERKLVSIQKVLALDPIEGADKIEVATVLGWKVVVKKGDFKVGDAGCFFEVDSLLPRTSWSEFLDTKGNKKMRIKTIRLRKQISQGLLLPLSILPEGSSFNEEDDVTEVLGVVKYEPPEDNTGKWGFNIGKRKSTFPSHLCPKTDEMRIQSSPKLLKEFEGLLVAFTTKVDGTSATFVKGEDEYHVCSRNMSISAPEDSEKKSVYWEMHDRYNIKKILENVGPFAIQGEVAGPGIQSNRMGLSDIDLFVFNVYNVVNKKRLGFQEFLDFCSLFNLKTVPVEKTNLLFSGFTVDDLVRFSNGVYQPSGHRREGIVIRPMVETYSEYLRGSLSVKVINPLYSLETDS